MKILVITSHLDRSERFLFCSLAGMGMDINIVCSPLINNTEQLTRNGMKLIHVDISSRYDRRAICQIRRQIKQFNPDIVHTLNKKALLNSLTATRGLPVKIVTYRGIIGNLSRWNPETRLTFMNPRVSAVICVCNAVRDYLAGLIAPDKLYTIYKGHDPDWYTPAEKSSLHKHRIPPDSPIIGCSAKMRPRKGIGVLLRALDMMKNTDAHLVLTGEITDRKIKPLINHLDLNNRVHIMGYRKDAHSLMGAVDLFVMPSLRREGLPRSVIEAMAQGVPAVVTEVGGMPELMEHNKSGLVVRPGNPGEMAAAMDELVSNRDKRDTMGRMAMQRISSNFNIETTVAQTARLYRQLTHPDNTLQDTGRQPSDSDIDANKKKNEP